MPFSVPDESSCAAELHNRQIASWKLAATKALGLCSGKHPCLPFSVSDEHSRAAGVHNRLQSRSGVCAVVCPPRRAKAVETYLESL